MDRLPRHGGRRAPPSEGAFFLFDSAPPARAARVAENMGRCRATGAPQRLSTQDEGRGAGLGSRWPGPPTPPAQKKLRVL